MRLGIARLLFDIQRVATSVELHHPVALGIPHAIGEDGGAALVGRRGAQLLRQAVPIEEVVSQHQRHAAIAHEFAPDDERLREPFRTGLLSVAQ